MCVCVRLQDDHESLRLPILSLLYFFPNLVSFDFFFLKRSRSMWSQDRFLFRVWLVSYILLFIFYFGFFSSHTSSLHFSSSISFSVQSSRWFWLFLESTCKKFVRRFAYDQRHIYPYFNNQNQTKRQNPIESQNCMLHRISTTFDVICPKELNKSKLFLSRLFLSPEAGCFCFLFLGLYVSSFMNGFCDT